jgi:hypothetical protein
VAVLPATQGLVGAYRECRELKARAAECDARRKALNLEQARDKLETMVAVGECTVPKERAVLRRDAEARKRERHREIGELADTATRARNRARWFELNGYAHAERYPTQRVAAVPAPAPEPPRARIVCACPADECRGYVTDEAWTCGTCERATCKACHCLAGETLHVCDPGAVATAKLLARDTKACPSCAAPIHKISGCSQMWCVACHVTFDWNTMEIERDGVLHNPHYYEWLRRAGRDEPVGGQAMICENGRLDYRHPPGWIRASELLMGAFRARNHLHQSIPELRRDLPGAGQVDPRLGMRLAYLTNEISREEFKVRLQRLEKKEEKARAVIEAYETYVAALGDILLGERNVERAETETKGLIEYVDENLRDIGRRLGMTVHSVRVMVYS